MLRRMAEAGSWPVSFAVPAVNTTSNRRGVEGWWRWTGALLRDCRGVQQLGSAHGLARMAVVTSVMAPYRTPVFNSLAARGDVDLLVLYQSEESPVHGWGPRRNHMRFRFVLLPHVAALGKGLPESGFRVVFLGI